MLKASVRVNRQCEGFSLIEVMVTIVVMLLGLLGVLGMQVKAAGVELESYQRGQALTLARDMAARIAASRNTVTGGYLNSSLSSANGSLYVGVGGADLGACPVGTSALTRATYEMCQWSQALKGAAEGTSAGAMIGARGCLISNSTATSLALADIYVVVVWQGMAVGKDPLGTAAGETATPMSQCASGVAFGTGLRRGVSVRVMVPSLT